MPESAPNWKSLRQELRSHLQHFHGGVGIGVSPALKVEELEQLHETLHHDEYALPPHDHEEPEEAYVVAPVKLKYGKKYTELVVRLARGERV